MGVRIKGVSGIAYFTHGKRGNLYTGTFKGNKVVIKMKRPESEAMGRIENEIKFLRIVNKKRIGPKVLFFDRKKHTYFGYRYIGGLFFPQFLEERGKKDGRMVCGVIAELFFQCFIMDNLGINKEEMSHPHKHIIIAAKTRKPVLIDFERCHFTQKPSNVTQFCSYLLSSNVQQILAGIGIRLKREDIISMARVYHQKVSRKNLDRIISSFSLSS